MGALKVMNERLPHPLPVDAVRLQEQAFAEKSMILGLAGEPRVDQVARHAEEVQSL
jgi:hypothetical protein